MGPPGHSPLGGADKKPWMHPMVPTPLLPLPTLSFTVSQVSKKIIHQFIE